MKSIINANAYKGRVGGIPIYSIQAHNNGQYIFMYESLVTTITIVLIVTHGDVACIELWLHATACRHFKECIL